MKNREEMESNRHFITAIENRGTQKPGESDGLTYSGPEQVRPSLSEKEICKNLVETHGRASLHKHASLHKRSFQ